MKRSMNNSYQKRTIRICRGTGCNSLNAEAIHENLIKIIQEENLSKFVKIKLTGCHGFCQVGPTLIIDPDNVLYVNLKANDIKDIVEQHLKGNKIVENLLYKDPKSGEYIKNIENIQFYSEQQPIITKNCGKINPEDIEEYISGEGYKSIKKVLNELSPDEVIEEIKKSGFRV